MHTYTYCLDGIDHVIKSCNPLESTNGVIVISSEQNVVAKKLKRLLKWWIRFANENDIDWFCNGGTLLGAIREKGLIHYDNDLDICVFFKDYEKIKNIYCEDKFTIHECEQGFQMTSKHDMFPFIDLWLVAPNPSNKNEIILAAPYLNKKLLFWTHEAWPNDKYAVGDVNKVDKLPFEGMMVNVPRNYEMYVKKMYGDDCLQRYVVAEHTGNHYISDFIPLPKDRMQIWTGLHKLSPVLVKSTIAILTAELGTSDKDKYVRLLAYLTPLDV
jgi:hypothetical protein